MIKPVSCCIVLSFFVAQVFAQSYHAFNGSPYAGVTAMYNNPASTVNQAYKWDVTLFGMQATISNTAFVFTNNSLTNTTGSGVTLSNGARPRYFHANADVDLFNARYKIDGKNAVAFGVRLRTYNHIKGMPFNFADTIATMQSFLHANNNVSYLDAFATHAGWAEINFNYSRIIFQSSSSSFSGGITVSYLKALSGAFVNFSGVSYLEKQNAGGNNYYLATHAALTAEYSANYLITNPANTTAQNVHNFLSGAQSSAGLDIGAEYLYKNDEVGDGGDVTPTNYDWKIGVSIMDVGRNSFNPITGSFAISDPLNVTDTLLQEKLAKVKNIHDISDTLSSLFGTSSALQNKFNVSLPTRVIISVDHSLGNHFFVNGELSLNFYSTQPAANLHTREINLLTVTPRWETDAWGVYLPVQYNAQGQFWVGAAVKLGPLLLGVHSLNITKWFKTGDQTYNGGGYLLLSIHPFAHRVRVRSSADCPVVE